MENLLEMTGVVMARVYMIYGSVFLILPLISFAYVIVLAGVIWTVTAHFRGRDAAPGVPRALRRVVRMAIEIVFGLANPLIYLVVLTSSLPELRLDSGWMVALASAAWILLAAVWLLRLLGRSIDDQSRTVLTAIRIVLIASFVCVCLFTIKDAALAVHSVTSSGGGRFWMPLLMALRVGPLYFVPALLLIDYLRSVRPDTRQPVPGFFLLSAGRARFAAATALVVLLVCLGLGMHRRSDASVRHLVLDNREAIRDAAARYDVDPKLIASIVYVTHRDQLSPFRGALETMVMSSWAHDATNDILLNRPLDISVGLAQVKPTTAQVAGLLATGRTLSTISQQQFFWYRGIDRVDEFWPETATPPKSLVPPFEVPSEKHVVVRALLDGESNLATCALILALYQAQWEAVNASWTIRHRPDILATLYQIGFARSRPHVDPKSNTFGDRVLDVYGRPWLEDAFNPKPGALGG